jgi:ATP-binding cassette subfamily F protein 3
MSSGVCQSPTSSGSERFPRPVLFTRGRSGQGIKVEDLMSILSTNNLGISFGAFDLFKGISVNIANDSKIGLIGPNGIGKTSLLLILAGINTPTVGQVHLARGRKLGYLRQEAVDAFANRENTVYAEMLTVFTDMQDKQNYLHELEARMGEKDLTNEEMDSLLEEYGRLQEAFDKIGGYDYEIQIQHTLEGLGLGKNHWHEPLNHLSGGQKTRALLARLLLEKPDLLMLDEPTNHLDIEAVEWLERALREWQGAVLIVSHDRYFLDATVNTIWEMGREGIQSYSGNYSAYLLQREERWEYYERVFKEEKERLLKEVDYIQRNWVRDSTHAQALGRLRRLTRDLEIVDQFGILALREGKKWSEYNLSAERPLDVIDAIRKVNAISMPSGRPPVIRPRLPEANTSGTIVLRIPEATFGYPNRPLFTARNIELRRGGCAVLIGPNGAGKTTFIKALLGQLEPLKGRFQLGASLKIGYFAQSHDGIQGDHSVLDELVKHKPMQANQARSYLAPYLFRGDDVFKPVSALSGGERARLALAILALDGANFLLLDEPTNHLDIPARESLQAVLENFSGTILLVSHDRYMIDRLATQIWDLHDGELRVFQGNYREFILRQAARSNAVSARQVLLTPKPLMRDNSKETRQRALDLSLLEDRIHEKEKEIQHLSNELQKAGQVGAFEKMTKISDQVAQAQATLENLISEWEKIAA